MQEIINKILNLIYPPVCGFCGEISKDSLCNKCKINLKEYELNKLEKNRNKEKYYDEIFYLLKYKSLVREKIIEYKFRDKSYLYKTFSEIILKNKKLCSIIKKYDIIIPVPIHAKRKRTRGYNQTELIAKEIAKKLNIEPMKGNLVKTKNIKPQSELGRKERKQNIKNVFEVKKWEEIKSKKIIIFDDIYTTGSTVNECARVLKESGAQKIGVITLAKD